MSSSTRLLLLGFTYVLYFRVSGGQKNFYSWLETINNTDTGNETDPSSCMWEKTPWYGYSFTACPQSPGVCKGVEGSYKKSGTSRVTQCRQHFTLAWGRDMDLCDNGQWTSSEHKCVPCGRSQRVLKSKTPSSLTSRGELPWQGALYTQLDEDKWELICGATLVSSSIALTAAHCLSLAGVDFQPSSLRVGLGKLYGFDTNETSSVISTVKEVIRPEEYDGLNSEFDGDIALLVLSESVRLGPRIMPVCIDWKGSMTVPKNNETGFLADWQVRHKLDGSSNLTLHWNSLKYMDYNACRSLGEEFITKEKFCASEVEEFEGEHEDNGGGLTFVRDEVHYLYGIVNTKLFGEESNLRVFTNILSKRYRTWLIKQLQRVHSGPPNHHKTGENTG